MAQTTMKVPEWFREEADKQDLSLSEYVRRMVRAGHRQFGYDYEPDEVPRKPKTLKIEAETTSSEVREVLKQWIEANLSTDTAQDVDDLVVLLENDIIELADGLCDEGRAKYRRGDGGYLKVTDNE